MSRRMGDTRWESPMSTKEDVMVLEEIFDDVPPDASAMVESMRTHGYSLSTTVAENGWGKIPTPKQTGQIFKAQDFLKEREGDMSDDEE